MGNGQRYLKINTDACRSYGARLAKVIEAYQNVRLWASVTGAKATVFADKLDKENVLEGVLETLIDAVTILPAAAKITANNEKIAACAALTFDTGVKHLSRTENHFRYTAAMVEEAEQGLLDKGGHRLNL